MMQAFKQETAQDASMAKPAGESKKQAGDKGPRSCEVPNRIDLQPQKCPRCGSCNTKFCYYNNYSLSQPRHFCKNCRRYWTRGGTLRNVPIGGGCRKNKRFKQQQQQPLRSTMDNGNNFISVTESFMHLPNPVVGPSSASGYDLRASESTGSTNSLGMTFSRLQESVRMHGGQPGADSPSLFNFLPPTTISPNCYSSYPGFNPASTNLELVSCLSLREAGPKTYAAVTENQSIARNPSSSMVLSSSIATKLDDLSGFTYSPHPAGSCTQFLSKMGEHLSSFNSIISDTASIDEPHHYNIGLGCGRPEVYVEGQDALDIREEAWRCGMKERPPTGEDSHCAELDNNGMFGSLASEASLWTASWPEMHAALAGTITTAGALLH